jgi:RimJ/RimL family protein N-acetyltransferase
MACGGVWPSDTRILSGFCGLWPFRDPPELELVYGIAEDLWGKGYAIEVAQAVIDYCFDSLDMSVVRASTAVPNAASIRVLEKLGFEFVRRATSGGRDTVFYHEIASRESQAIT